MTILILHGIGGHAGIHWQQWLHDGLRSQGHTVIMPDLPHTKHPDRQDWLATVSQLVAATDPSQLVIVGHSLGVTTALDFIEQSKTPIKALMSASGFAVDYGAELNSYFLKERSINFQKVRANLGNATVFYANDDPYVTQSALKNLADELKVKPIIIAGGGHLNTERGLTKFSQLLEAILKIIEK